MKVMEQEYQQIVNECITFARQFLDLPPKIDLYFEDCPSQRFPRNTNACETNGKVIYFNKPWFLQRINEHRDDLEFFVFHELRHVHQRFSVFKMNENIPTQDSYEKVRIWDECFHKYIRNVDEKTERDNVMQEIEIDANAYGIVLTNLLHISDDMELHFSAPEYAMNVAFERSKQYYADEVKIKSFIDEYEQSKVVQPIHHAQKYERNKPCPCGSGLKWKKCDCKECH